MAANPPPPSTLGAWGAMVNKPVIPLIPKVDPEKVEKVTIRNYINIGTAANPREQKRLASIPFANSDDPESLLRTIIEFMDACQNSRLRLTTGELRYDKVRECL